MIIIIIIALYCVVCVVLGLVQYFKSPKPPNGLTWKEYHNYYSGKEWLFTEEEEDASQTERVQLLDETIVKYQRLLDTLTAQYKDAYTDTDKSKILSKQISTMEKLNRALEKREKLE